MSENKNHIFTFDNRIISYSVYEQALKDIEALREENKSLQAQVDVMSEAFRQMSFDDNLDDYVSDLISEALAKVAEIKGKG